MSTVRPPADEPKTTKIFDGARERLDVPGLIVCVATRGSVSVETFSSAVCGFNGFAINLLVAARKPVDVARNELAGRAQALAQRPELLPYDVPELYVFWFDDDSFWSQNMLRQGVQYLKEHPQIDLIAGYFCDREEWGMAIAEPLIGGIGPNAMPKTSGAVEVRNVGFHWLLHRTSVLDRVGENPFSPIDGLGEDLSFCKRARAAGVRMFVAPEIVVPHVEVETGRVFMPGREAWRSAGNSIMPPEKPELRSFGETVDAVLRSARPQ